MANIGRPGVRKAQALRNAIPGIKVWTGGSEALRQRFENHIKMFFEELALEEDQAAADLEEDEK